jgi:hypothetical protein
MSKYGAVIHKVRQENQEAGNPESIQTRKPETEVKDEEVNLSIKVPKKRRQHWAAEAKRQGTTITAVVMEALSAKFGEPEA